MVKGFGRGRGGEQVSREGAKVAKGGDFEGAKARKGRGGWSCDRLDGGFYENWYKSAIAINRSSARADASMTSAAEK